MWPFQPKSGFISLFNISICLSKKILLVFETNLLAKFRFREYDMYKWRHWTLLVKPFRIHFPRKKELLKKMECDSRDMFLSWQNKQNVKVDLWKWKCTHISRRSDTVNKLKRGFELEIGSTLLTKWGLTEFLSVLVMPDREVNFKIQTSVLS